MIKIAIIGAGNMGGAIARSIATSKNDRYTLSVANPHKVKLEALTADFPEIYITTDNVEVTKNADVLILAVKPYVLESVASELKNNKLPSVIVSVVAGVDTEKLHSLFGNDKSVFRVIPNTAITIGKGMTFFSSSCARPDEIEMVRNIFEMSGIVAEIPESKMGAATALCSCGIAYVYKYIQACIQAGVQMGFRPDEALEFSTATVNGAAEMLRQNRTTPQTEIDRVTTPGGMTIKGINSLEHTGFTSSVINAILEPLK